MENFKGKGKFYAIKCDVSKESDVNETFEWVKKKLNTIHVLVNNAGIVIPGKIIGITILFGLKCYVNKHITSVIL